jgi:hypothetical protein
MQRQGASCDPVAKRANPQVNDVSARSHQHGQGFGEVVMS